MIAVRTLTVFVLFTAGLSGIVVFGRGIDHKDDYVYDQLVTIRGKVEILNHPELGRTEGSSMPLVFQRDGCRMCLVATRTDMDGNYEITVARGRYKIIVRETRGGGAASYDLLAPNQPRYINATLRSQPNVLNLQVMLPPN
jgi:hypothetical protein